MIAILKEESHPGETLMNSSIQRGQQKKELSKPNSKTNEESTSKEVINISNHNQRTVENYSFLTEKLQS